MVKKTVIVSFFLYFLLSLFGRTYTQKVFITPGNGNQEIEFDYYDHGHDLTNVNVKLYTTVSGGNNAADNDADETINVIIHLGAAFSLTDRYDEFEFPNLPRLLDSEGSPNNIWYNETETTWDDELGPENGDGTTFDSTSPDGVSHDGLSLNDTKVDDIYASLISKYEGEGTFIFDLAKAQSNSIETEGSAVAGQYNPVSIGGYVQIIYTDDDPLPVQLTEFTVNYCFSDVELRWLTQTEINNSHWNIYRSVSSNFGQAVQVNPSIIEGAGNSSEPVSYYFVDHSEFENEITYFYWIESVDFANVNDLYGPIEFEYDKPIQNEDAYQEGIIATSIQSVYPNPFNPDATISYYLQYNTPVELEIYNVKGQKVQYYDLGNKTAGTIHRTSWNGKDFQNRTVPTGVYLFKLITNKDVSVSRAVLQK